MLEKDKEFFIGLFKLFPKYKYALCTTMEEVEYELEKEGAPKCFVMIDEADYFWIDKMARPNRYCWTVGFSATDCGRVEGIESTCVEESWLKANGVKIFDCKMPPLTDLEGSVELFDSAEEWYVAKGNGKSGLLVYCNMLDVLDHRVLAKRQGYKDIYVDPNDTAKMTNITGSVVIITDTHPEVMRGTDTRTKTSLHLLLCSSLPNSRAYTQALGRVGRGGDKGSRSRLRNVSSVDADAVRVHVGKLREEEKRLLAEQKETQKEKRRVANLRKAQ